MFDELKLNLGSKFMRKLATKFLKRYIKKQFGYDVKIDLEELNIEYRDGDVKIKTNLEFQMDRYEFKKVLKKIEDFADEEDF